MDNSVSVSDTEDAGKRRVTCGVCGVCLSTPYNCRVCINIHVVLNTLRTMTLFNVNFILRKGWICVQTCTDYLEASVILGYQVNFSTCFIYFQQHIRKTHIQPVQRFKCPACELIFSSELQLTW